MKRLSGVVAVSLVAALFGGCASASPPAPSGTSASNDTPSVATPSAVRKKGSVRVVRTITTGLDVPWGMAVLPGGKALLLTQRNSGKVTRVDDDFADIEIAQGVKIKVVKSTISDVLQPGAKPAND